MPRTARSIAAGVCYHAFSRTNAGLSVFDTPANLDAFVNLMAAAQRRIELDLLAICLMPNHFHLVVRPRQADDLTRWVHWLLTTHGRRYHKHHGTCGRIWQGRFKAFAIQQDEHLITVLRYVERNALRAGLVRRAEDWGWGSLAWRLGHRRGLDLADCQVPLPQSWAESVNEPLSANEIRDMRTCLTRQRPYGAPAWVRSTADKLGLKGTLGRIGRPKKSASDLRPECLA